MTSGPNKYYRSLFLSDFHLGSHKSKAERLFCFFKKHHAHTIYLIGDVFDGNYDKTWPDSHKRVIDLLIKRLARGTRIVYIPGNHDQVFRKHYGEYGNLIIAKSACHEMVDGRCLYVAHGDETDMIRFHFVLRFIIRLERITKWHLWEILRSKLSGLIERHTKKFEMKMIKIAYSYAGVACGHIHKPNIILEPKIYINTGDWTYHCTAIAEKLNGEFELLKG